MPIVFSPGTVYSITLGDYRPSPRFPPVTTPWTLAQIAYAPSGLGPFVPFDTITLPNPDPDPANPAVRNLTTLLAPSPSGWFQVTFIDGVGTAEPTDPISFPALTPDLDYVSMSELKATLELSGETFADPDVSLAITAASRSIDQLCRRRFWADADANQVRYYTPTSPRLVRIDDLVTLTELATGLGQDTFDVTWTENAQYVLKPLNAPADGWPFTRIRAISQHFSWHTRSVRVTGRFGWSAVPDEIQEATGILAARLMRRAREAPFGVIGFGMDANNAVRLARQDPDVMMLAGPYVRQLVA